MQESSLVVSMACMTSGASSVTLQSLYWRSSNNFSVPAESSRVNWCSPARRLEDEILESRSLFKGRWSKRPTSCHTSWAEVVRAHTKCDCPAPFRGKEEQAARASCQMQRLAPHRLFPPRERGRNKEGVRDIGSVLTRTSR